MGNPLRFFGPDEPLVMGDVVLPSGCPVEITFGTYQQRHFLRPDPEATELVLGCLGRVAHRYPEVKLHAVKVVSNHGNFIATPSSTWVMSEFMRDFLSATAKRINRLRKREGALWRRRYRGIPILDDERADERLAYVLNHGTKENLVASARQWPGPSSLAAQLGGPPLVGRWRDFARETELSRQQKRRIARAAARGETRAEERVPRVWIEYPIALHPLPSWRGLKVGQQRARIAAMVREDERATRARHAAAGTRPLGVRKVLRVDPNARPAHPARSPAPLCHTREPPQGALRRAFRRAYRRFVEATREAREALEVTARTVGLPRAASAGAIAHGVDLPPRRPDPEPTVVWLRRGAGGVGGTGPPRASPA